MNEKKIGFKCPKCGSVNVWHHRETAVNKKITLYYVQCHNCNHKSVPSDRDYAAIENWNQERNNSD